MGPKNFLQYREATYFHYCVRLQEELVHLADPSAGMHEVTRTLHTLAPSESIIHAFCYMGDHFHLLIDLNEQSPFTYPGYLSQMWKPIISFAAFLETYRYIYRNPIEAGLCVEPEKYPFSSLSWILGRYKNPGLDVIDHLRVIQNPSRVLHWIKGGPSPFLIPKERYLW